MSRRKQTPRDETYLDGPSFDPISGTVTADLEYPSFAGDFELYALMSSTTAAARIDVLYSGRLYSYQGTIEEITLALVGNAGAQYQVKVYVEGSGASQVYTPSALTAAPLTRTVITISAGDLSAQPTGEGRYFVVVEATLDAGEELRVGRPLAVQEE